MYIPPDVIERCNTPRGEIQLQRRGNHYEIISNGTFLMATYNDESERLLVKAALDVALTPERVLIGGLGVGFSLAEALNDRRVSQVKVIEIVDKVIEWNQSYLAPFSNNSLEDYRTEVVHADLLEWIHRREGQFEVICLDIDNGPDWTVTEANARLYQKDSLVALSDLLASNGVITFWSASPSPEFVGRLRHTFHKVIELAVPQEGHDPDYVYIASLPINPVKVDQR
ncbi:spermine/spermidine synthase [Fictibacillus sp. FJAT-27399]|uniref:spermine/spermidine synthase domain-containing protein n=1 Tax=Fictibacillus sp. FJAT-27399 TaxID=1729689 RepID=UPI000AEE90FB|nr:spermine/spermidine synthase [Fictibacillus sp. FJAT-27399]